VSVGEGGATRWNGSIDVMKIVEWATSEGNGDGVWSLLEIIMVLPREKANNTEVFSAHVLFRVKAMSFV
jgi:hypothetical protein